MSTIASLKVLLTADVGPMQKGYSAATAATQKFAGSIQSVGNSGGGLMSMIGGKATIIAAAVTAVAGVSLKAAGDLSKATKELDGVLSATGNTTGLTRAEMIGLADDLQKTTNFSHRATIQAEAMLASFDGIHGDTFKAALKSAQDLSAFTGGDLNASVEKVGRALENPARGLKMLGREGLISPAQQASIATMLKAGNTAAAQTAILDSLKGRIGGMAEAMASPMKQLKNEITGIFEKIGTAIKPLVGMVLNIIRPVIEVFTTQLDSIGPATQRILAYLGGIIGSAFSAYVRFVMNGCVAIMRALYDGVSAVVDYAAPVVVSFGDLIGDIFNSAAGIATWLWDAIGDAFNGIATVIGDCLAAVGITFGTTSKAAGTMMDYIQATLIVIEFGFTHWKETLELVGASVAYGIVRFANQTVYYFGTVLPATLDWYGKHWREVFTDILSMVEVVSGNIWTNLTNLWDAITGIFNGDGFHFTWKPLTEGFKTAITELPKIAERQIGPLEGALKQQVSALANNVDRDFATFAAERTQKVADQAATLRDKIHKDGLAGLVPKLADAPKLAGGPRPGQQLLGGQTESGKVGALVKGSEDAFKATHGQQALAAALLDMSGKQLNALNRIADNTGGDDTDDLAVSF